MSYRQDPERFEAIMARAEAVLTRAERLLMRYEPDGKGEEWKPPLELIEPRRHRRRRALDDREVAAVITCLGCHAGLAKLHIDHVVAILFGS